MLAEEIRVEIKAVADKAIREMKQFQNETKKTTTSSQKMGKTLGDVKVRTLAVAGAIGGAVAVFKKLAASAQVWIGAASDAEEITSKFAVTFNDVAYEAEQAATALADSYGMAESTAKDLLSATGDMLSGFGATDDQALELSEKVQQLAVDLASFTNYAGGAKGASEALTKGLLGEREMMKSLGIAIQEADVKQRILEKGQADLEGTAMKMARAEATLELAYEQSANAMGDYARTQDSYANITRRGQEASKELREELGRKLIPAATEIRKVWTGLIERMADAVKTSNDLRDALQLLETGNLQEATLSGLGLALEKLQGDLESSHKQMSRFGITLEEAKEREEELEAALKAGSGTLAAQNAVELTNIRAKRQLIEQTQAEIEAVEKEILAKQELMRVQRLNSLATDEGTEELRKQNERAEKRAKIESDFATLIRKRIQLQNDLVKAEDDINKKVELGFMTAEEGEEKRQELILETRDALIEVSDGFDDVADVAKTAFTDAEIAAKGFTKTAYNDIVAGLIRGMNEELLGADETQEAFFASFLNNIMKAIEDGERLNEKLSETKGFFQSFTDIYREQMEEGLAAIEAKTKAWEETLISLGQTTQPVFEEMGKAIADSEKGWLAVGKAAVKAVAQIIRALGEQAAVEAAITWAKVAGGAAWLTGKAVGLTTASAAAFITAGVVEGLAGQITTAATGADFTTSGPQMMLVGDNPGGRERVSVTPLSSPNINGPGSGSTIVFNAPIYGVDGLAQTMEYARNKLLRRGLL